MPFSTLFTDFPEERMLTYTEGAVFRKNPLLKQRLPLLRDAFTTILVEICLQSKGVVKQCEIVEKLTDDYRLTQDRVAFFIDARIERKQDSQMPVTLLRVAIKEWHRAGNEAALDLNMVINRLMREPYNYPFNSIRSIGFNFIIRDSFAAPAFEQLPVSVEQAFIEHFQVCHEATLHPLDYVPVRDVAIWSAHNMMDLRNKAKMMQLVRAKYIPLGVKEKNMRIPRGDGSTQTVPKDCFVGLKRLMWREDHSSPLDMSSVANSEVSSLADPDEEA